MTRIHPFEMYDRIAAAKVEEIRDFGRGGVEIAGVHYISDTSVPYTGTNPEFLAVLESAHGVSNH